MFLRKAEAGSAPGFVWYADGDVLEVPDGLGEQLLAIPRGGFTKADPPPPVLKTAVEEGPEPLPARGRKAATGSAK